MQDLAIQATVVGGVSAVIVDTIIPFLGAIDAHAPAYAVIIAAIGLCVNCTHKLALWRHKLDK